MSQHAEAELNAKFVETAKLMNVYLNHFPRFEKYALAQQIRACMYEVYALIVEAQKRYHKKTTLSSLDIRHEQWRMLVNLADALGYFEFKDGKEAEKSPAALAAHRFLAISRLIDELGRMIGGWVVLHDRAHHGLFSAHATIKARIDGLGVNSFDLCPLADAMRHAFNRYRAIAASIIRLIRRGCPSTISRRVVAAGINTVNGHAFGPLSHVGNKVGKAFAPSIANRNSACAVKREADIRWNMATRNHVFPRLALSIHTTPTVRVAIRHAGFSTLRRRQTPARTNLAALHFRRYRFASTAALALKKPDFQSFCVTAGRSNRRQLAEGLPSNVGEFVHDLHCNTSRLNFRIREHYTVDDEIKLLRTAPSPEFELWNAYVEDCREWGRQQKRAFWLEGAR